MATQPASASAPLSAGQEWRLYWPLVVAAMMGVSFSSIPSATLGLFIDPLHREFGWTSAQISLGFTVFAAISVPATPLGGYLADRFGGRRVAIPGLVLCGLTFAAFAAQTGLFVLWLVGWSAYTLASITIRSLVFNRTISSVFSAGRGLALALVVSGLSLPLVVAPPLTEWLIGNFGWREAYVALGLGWTGFALLLVIPLFKAPEEVTAQAASTTSETTPSPAPAAQGGLSVKQALRDVRTLRIAGAIALQALANSALGIHLVPLLVSGGITRMEAASLAAVLGVTNLAGNLATGWLVDRVSSPVLPFSVFSLAALGFFVLLNAGGEVEMILLAILFLGLGGGGALQLGMYLTTRYAGVRNFATIYGLINSLQTLTSGIGPWFAGFVFDTTGNYTQFLWAGIPVYIVSGLLVFGLGRYPDHAGSADDATGPAKEP